MDWVLDQFKTNCVQRAVPAEACRNADGCCWCFNCKVLLFIEAVENVLL